MRLTIRHFFRISILTILLIQVSCSVTKNPGWVASSSHDIGWTEMTIDENISYDLAWDEVSSIIARRFEPEMMNKETGYIRTKWRYNWKTNGKLIDTYRVRAVVKMSELRHKIAVNAEAQKKYRNDWHTGYDTELLTQIKEDIAGVVGM